MNFIKKAAITVMFLFYLSAGINHFIKPATYISLIPPYLPFPDLLNSTAGFFEIAFALFLIPIKTRKLACWGIILMLIAFMPAHIFMIQQAYKAPIPLANITITPLIAWVRIPLQFVLIIWAFWCSKMKFN